MGNCLGGDGKKVKEDFISGRKPLYM